MGRSGLGEVSGEGKLVERKDCFGVKEGMETLKESLWESVAEERGKAIGGSWQLQGFWRASSKAYLSENHFLWLLYGCRNVKCLKCPSWVWNSLGFVNGLDSSLLPSSFEFVVKNNYAYALFFIIQNPTWHHLARRWPQATRNWKWITRHLKQPPCKSRIYPQVVTTPPTLVYSYAQGVAKVFYQLGCSWGYFIRTWYDLKWWIGFHF